MDWGHMGNMIWLMMGIMPIAAILLAIWVYNDANKYSDNAFLWVLLVFCTIGIGALVYALIRTDTSKSHLSNTGSVSPQQVNKGKDSSYCRTCGDLLALDDVFCPSCGAKVSSL